MAPDSLSPILDSAPRGATRLQLQSASRMAQGLARSSAAERVSELFTAADNLLRSLRDLQHCGVSKDFLWDTAGGAIDQIRNAQHAIDTELDEQGVDATHPLDLSELHAFWESVR